MSDSFAELLDEHPEVRRLYETNHRFRMQIDRMRAIFADARENLSDEDHAEFLKWSTAIIEEWK